MNVRIFILDTTLNYKIVQFVFLMKATGLESKKKNATMGTYNKMTDVISTKLSNIGNAPPF